MPPAKLVNRGPSASVAFVYETHPVYRDYINAHFNLSNPFVRSIVEMRGRDAFLNGGVFVVDAVRWRQKKLTQLAEEGMKRNEREFMFNTAALGDQGPFFLFFINETSYLSPRYNMRRLPKKTVHLLEDGQKGS